MGFDRQGRAQRAPTLASLLLGAALLSGCATASLSRNSPDDWQCTAIDPGAETLPDDACFRARLQNDNEISLEWRVTNSRGLVYLIDDTGVSYNDPGHRRANCLTPPAVGCSARFRVNRGGFHRYLLKVEHIDGRAVFVPAELDVPSPYPPLASGGGHIDPLAVQAQVVSWQADERNITGFPHQKRAWVNVQDPVTKKWQTRQFLPRSGDGARYELPASALTDRETLAVNIRDCRLPRGSRRQFCSDAVPVIFLMHGDHLLHSNPLYLSSDRDFSLHFTTRAGTSRRLASQTLLPEGESVVLSGMDENSYLLHKQALTAGEHSISIESCSADLARCTPAKTLRVLVDYPVDWSLARPYTEDFYPANTYSVLGEGEPLDITYADNGDIWMVNEFSNNLERVTGHSGITTLNVPLARTMRFNSLSEVAVDPFSMTISEKLQVPASFSALAERVVQIGSDIWFTQGGSVENSDGQDSINASRLIAFNPQASNSIRTAQDDRFCVYNIPPPEDDPAGNNQIIGLSYAAGRVWFSEARGFRQDTPSAISSFVPDPALCENTLDYSDRRAMQRAVLQYCKPDKAPHAPGCITSRVLQYKGNNIKAAQLAIDPQDDSLWFADYRGRFLGNLESGPNGKARFYDYPESHLPKAGKGSFFAGFAWAIHVDADAVYFSEYRARRILRFDKKSEQFAVIDVPAPADDVLLHSLAMDKQRGRLWFTLTNELAIPPDPAGSTIGYIDLASWRRQVARADPAQPVKGVVYSGLASIAGDPTRAPVHQAFRGIAVEPDTGKIALATMHRRQVTELTPRPTTKTAN